jgi:hypothetical protein
LVGALKREEVLFSLKKNWQKNKGFGSVRKRRIGGAGDGYEGT